VAVREVTSLAELKALEGSEVGVSRWFEMSQQRIDTFADATDDHQWIHQDQQRCASESPFGGTVAHGFLTLSLLPAMLDDAIAMRDVKVALNYGLNKVRFPAPVPEGSRVRARIGLRAVDEFDGGAQLVWDILVECEGGDKPVCVAEFLTRRYP
jgi:acyl dehydratase